MHAAAAALRRRRPQPLLPLLDRRRRAFLCSRSSSSSSSSSEDAYLETWQRRQVRPQAFYEAEGKHRRWMYTVDLQGRLFLEELRKKDLTSCLKNDKFLIFFFSQVRRNDTGLHPEYPFVSPCGREMNFILPADMPIVFTDLVQQQQQQQQQQQEGSSGGWELRYAGGLAQAFDPAAIFISPRTGRLYHTLEWKRQKQNGAKEKEEGRPRFGLLRSHVGLLLMDRIHYEEEAPTIEWPAKGEEGGPTTRRFPIQPLPAEEEPVWGLPPMPHDD